MTIGIDFPSTGYCTTTMVSHRPTLDGVQKNRMFHYQEAEMPPPKLVPMFLKQTVLRETHIPSCDRRGKSEGGSNNTWWIVRMGMVDF